MSNGIGQSSSPLNNSIKIDLPKYSIGSKVYQEFIKKYGIVQNFHKSSWSNKWVYDILFENELQYRQYDEDVISFGPNLSQIKEGDKIRLLSKPGFPESKEEYEVFSVWGDTVEFKEKSGLVRATSRKNVELVGAGLKSTSCCDIKENHGEYVNFYSKAVKFCKSCGKNR